MGTEINKTIKNIRVEPHNTIWEDDPAFAEIYKIAAEIFNISWLAEDIDLKNDTLNFKNESEKVQDMIISVIALFTKGDEMVDKNCGEIYSIFDGIREIEFALTVQAFNEQVHHKAYSNILIEYVPDSAIRNKKFDEISAMVEFAAIEKWIKDNMIESNPIQNRIVVFLYIESIFFQGLFPVLFYFSRFLKRNNYFKGLDKTNEAISTDENLHTKLGAALLKVLVNKPTEEFVFKVAAKTADLIKSFIRRIIDNSIFIEGGLSVEQMESYIDFLIDRVTYMLCGRTIFGAIKRECPIQFMAQLCLPVHVNFHEQSSASYFKNIYDVGKSFRVSDKISKRERSALLELLT